jgi:uncharacterized membrane protein
MRLSSLHFFPLALPFMLALVFIIALVLVALEIGIIQYAYEKIGVSPRHVVALLMLSLLGSSVNIPLAHLPGERIVTGEVVAFFGVRYVVPTVEEWPGTVIAVNLGGAVVPTLLSLYLIVKNGMYVRAFAGVVIVAAIVHRLAYPVQGVGIAVPTFVPPLIAAVTSLFLARSAPAPLAYVAGTLGTLIGADLLNLGRIRGLGAPVASIGGAGTFDGVFLTGILAVLLA